MSTFRIDFEHRDLVKMYKTLDKVGKSPQKALNKGTSKAAAIVKRTVKGAAPEKTGALKSGIVTRNERSSRRGKKVRQTTFKEGSGLERVLGKNSHPGKFGGRPGGKDGDRYYYPASQEYGWLTGDGNGGTKYIPGKRYMLRGAEAASEPAKKAMIETMTKELDKAWKESP